MEYPSLTVLLVTYNRPEEIRKTINALGQHINYPGPLNWHLADDHSPGSYVEDIFTDFPHLHFTGTVTDRKGWGANVNKALKYIRDDFIFLCEDDYVAEAPLNLRDGVAVMQATPSMGIIRYDGLAGHIGLNLWIREAVTETKTISYAVIDREQSGHLNVYSNRPHLRHRRMSYDVGYYAENRRLGETEEAYAHKVINTDPGCDVAILDTGISRAFAHIGASRQGTALDHPK